MRRGSAMAAAAVVTALLTPGAADAARKDPNESEPPRCLSEADVRSFNVSKSSARLRQPLKFSWDIRVPRGCSQKSLDLQLVYHCYTIKRVSGLRGSVTLPALGTTSYSLIARKAGASRSLGRQRVSVDLRTPPPAARSARGHVGTTPQGPVTINANDMAPTLTQALGIENQTIHVAPNVNISLFGCDRIRVAQGVQLLGRRSAADPGPRIHTRSYPNALLRVVGDNVRISGMRIEGARLDVYSGNLNEVYGEKIDKVPGLDPIGRPEQINISDGIEIASNTGVEIDNNEIFGWMGSGVEIRDEAGRIPHEPPYAVRVHDNYFHHNRRGGGDGYGVSVYDGAFPLIDRNVFDYNRHAIAGDGDREAGYALYDNVVFPNGGEHVYIKGYGWRYTHQIDMHGESSCFLGHLNCGIGGHHMDIQHNAVLYTRAAAVKLRGYPQDPRGMFIANNSFRHGEGSAIEVTVPRPGISTENNEFEVGPSLLRCDFDGRDPLDHFMATGRTWWYSLRGHPHWFFMQRSTERPATCPPLIRDHRLPPEAVSP